MISFFSHGNHSAFSNLYGTNPFSISSLAKGLALDPLSKIMYLIILNAPFLFLAFIDPIFILELPWFLAVMVSVFYPYWYPLVYYGSYIAPFAVLGFLKGVERIRHIIKIRCLKILFSFLLSVNILMWILVNGIAIFHTSPVYPIPSQDLGVFKLADMIPQGSSVYTHSCCLSIVSSHSWDSWFNGNLSTTWMLFNSCNGPPTNISSYKLYAAEGDFMLYKLDYDGPTVVDNYYLNASYGQTYPAIPYSISHRFFIPKGNYTAEIFIKGNGVYPKIINYFSNASSRFYLNSSYALIQRFSINCQINLGELILFGKFSLGEYKIITKISTSLNPSSVIQSSTVIHPSYVINNSEVFRFDNLQLEPDKTYYLWICIEGSPKYVYLQGVHGTNGLYYKVNSNYANVNGSLKFTLVASNDFYSVAHPSNFVVVINNSSYHLQVNKCCTLILHLDLNSPTYVKICFNASEPYSTFRLSVFIHDNNYHELHSFVLQEPYTVLTIFSIPSIIIMLSSLKLKKLSLPRSRLTLITLITLLGIFYVTFSLEYFDLIIVSPIILAIEGLAIAINLAYVFFSEFTVEYIKQ
ncbi:hypothetical protein HS5_14160 [Acidianus sp. HS-5]|nr:hypothetical protein HS5_14160 [Acidianus sp. HS-5]